MHIKALIQTSTSVVLSYATTLGGYVWSVGEKGEESGELIVAYYNVSIPTIHGKTSEGRDHITPKGSQGNYTTYSTLHGTTLQELLYKTRNTQQSSQHFITWYDILHYTHIPINTVNNLNNITSLSKHFIG